MLAIIAAGTSLDTETVLAAVRAPRPGADRRRRPIRAGPPPCAMGAAWSPTSRPAAMAGAHAAVPLCTAAGRRA